MAYKFTVSLPSRTLAEDFKRECKKRGHSQSYVLASAMRYFISHPYSRGWENGEKRGGDQQEKSGKARKSAE